MSFFGTGGRLPANREMPTNMIKNAENRPERIGRSSGNRTSRSAYFESEMIEPRRGKETFAEQRMRSEGDSFGQGMQSAASTEGRPSNYRQVHGIAFGKGFEERNETQSPANAAPAQQMAGKKKTIAGLPLETARAGIVLSEILGPPKGRAYFDRHFGR